MSVVDEDGRVTYGCFDGPVSLHAEAFRLRDFFGREVGALRRRLALGGFTFLGLATEDVLVGLAAVRLGYVAQVFGYLFDFRTGQLHQHSVRSRPSRLDFPLEPDRHVIHFDGSGCRLRIDKDHAAGRLEVAAAFGKRLTIEAGLPFGFDQKPLRVANPSCGDPFRFSFTEKCAALRPDRVSVRLDGMEQVADPARAWMVYDWSAGYFNRHTNWLWSAFAGRLEDGRSVGANFAALVNESFYPENAYWIDGVRTRLPRVIFDCDPAAPRARDWRIFTEDGRVDLRFHPAGERSERSHVPFLKLNFRQFMGSYTGTLIGSDGTRVRLDNLHGLAELHLSVW